MIPSKDLNKTDIAKWRPISLLCVDYKIITKTLTNRLLPTLQEIISIEQSAVVPNWTIYNNLFTIRDIIEYSNKKKILTYILKFNQGRKENLKLSQYADDTSFLSTNFSDIPFIFKQFSKYKTATGCSLNIIKTEGLLIQTNRVYHNNNKFPIKWNIKEFVKILGIHFNNDIEKTKRNNITRCIQKMENNVTIQNQKHLSVKGKTMIINTTLLSKLWYIGNVFPIPKDFLPEINKIIFKFLWNNKSPEPIARETLFLPRERGALGILVPSIQSQALRAKFLLQLGNENNTNIRTYLVRYWVASKIHNFTRQWNFLKKTHYPKNYDPYIPTHYGDVINLTKTNIKEIKTKTITTKNICNTIVGSLTKNYLLVNETRWNLINKNKALNWKQIWQNTFKAYNIPYENNLYYKAIHRILYVNQKTYNAKNKNNISPMCDRCRKYNETIYVFHNCRNRKKIWNIFAPVIKKLNPNSENIFMQNILG